MIRLSLDWTPNTNHTGFFVAQEKGFFKDLGLDLQISDPSEDDYQVTPAKKLEIGQADIALAPTESVISYRTKSNPFLVKAIGAVLQTDASALTVLADKGMDRPADLDGKLYASYQARYEDHIIKQMIINDGGEGTIKISYPDKLGIWNTLVEGQADATWIFEPWEGAEAEHRGIDLKNFRLNDYGIPYGYSPVLIASEDFIQSNREALESFMDASRKGFTFAVENPEEAAEILSQFVSEEQLQRIDLIQSQEMINPHYTSEGEWGKMRRSRWEEFINWLKDHDLISPDVKYQDLYVSI